MTDHQQKAVEAAREIIKLYHNHNPAEETIDIHAQIIASHFPVLSEANGPEPTCSCGEIREAIRKLRDDIADGCANVGRYIDLQNKVFAFADTPCPRGYPDRHKSDAKKCTEGCRCGELLQDALTEMKHIHRCVVNSPPAYYIYDEPKPVSLKRLDEKIERLESAIRKE